jgi:hypothetical protein
MSAGSLHGGGKLAAAPVGESAKFVAELVNGLPLRPARRTTLEFEDALAADKVRFIGVEVAAVYDAKCVDPNPKKCLPCESPRSFRL